MTAPARVRNALDPRSGIQWRETEYRLRLPAGVVSAIPWTRLPRIPATAQQQELAGLAVGTEYEFRTRLSDDAGNSSPWVYPTPVTIEPATLTTLPAPMGLRVECDLLVWEDYSGRDDIAGFEVRHAAEAYGHWEDAVPAHEGLVQSPLPICRIPGGTRTFLARAADIHGTPGAVATIVTYRGAYAVDEAVSVSGQTEGPGWTGTITGATVTGSALRADLSGAFWPDDDDRPFWHEDDSSLFWDTTAEDLVYETSITPALANDLATQVLTVTPTIGVGKNWRVEYRTDDSPFWNPDDGAPFWNLDDTAPFWARLGDDSRFWSGDDSPFWGHDDAPFWPEQPWRPWPGRLVGLQNQEYRIRVVIPGGAQRGRLDQLVLAISKPS